tara:strand:- start:176 stop:370 length:195 start_codon:yes stop_codon:yes gene_type:complete
MIPVREEKWIRYESGNFLGEPQSIKGDTGNWIPVAYLNIPAFGRTKEVRWKDEEYDICYIAYRA